MSDLVAIVYPTEAKAEEVRQRLLKLQKEYLISISDAVIAVKTEAGGIKLNQLVNTTAAGAISGSFWGLLVGVLFLNPIIGVAVGAASGAIGGALSDFGINDAFIKELSASLHTDNARYSYVFDGNSQALDHILVSNQVAIRTLTYDVVHVNSEFAVQDSDHDPQVLRYNPLQSTTAAELVRLTATRSRAGVTVRWRTGSEARIAGFNLYRERAGKLLKLNRKLIRAGGGARGHAYSWRDALARPGGRYRLQAVRPNGARVWLGSIRG